MNRVGASQLYYFSEEYFVRLSEALGQRCSLCLVELDGQIACAGLFAEHCGIIQYHLGGTKSEFLKQAPSKLMFDRARFWAKERGNEIFHLGGGVGSAKDSLYHFKAGFSQQRETFVTLSLIADAEKYNYLIGLRAKLLNIEPERLFEADFFPAYRASLS
jgi:lipid II:glycine glycyltransferase (peptidoglycan interpeptide bridge formation enzyme)